MLRSSRLGPVSQTKLTDFTSAAHHSTIEGSIFGRCSSSIIVIRVQFLMHDLHLCNFDNISRLERLELDVFADVSLVPTHAETQHLHPLWRILRDLELLVLVHPSTLNEGRHDATLS